MLLIFLYHVPFTKELNHLVCYMFLSNVLYMIVYISRTSNLIFNLHLLTAPSSHPYRTRYCHLAFPSVNTIFPPYLMLPSFSYYISSMFSESVDDM